MLYVLCVCTIGIRALSRNAAMVSLLHRAALRGRGGLLRTYFHSWSAHNSDGAVLAQFASRALKLRHHSRTGAGLVRMKQAFHGHGRATRADGHVVVTWWSRGGHVVRQAAQRQRRVADLFGRATRAEELRKRKYKQHGLSRWRDSRRYSSSAARRCFALRSVDHRQQMRALRSWSAAASSRRDALRALHDARGSFLRCRMRRGLATLAAQAGTRASAQTFADSIASLCARQVALRVVVCFVRRVFTVVCFVRRVLTRSSRLSGSIPR